MNSIKVQTLVDEAVARAVPALRPLLGKRIELIAVDSSAASERKLTVDEVLRRASSCHLTLAPFPGGDGARHRRGGARTMTSFDTNVAAHLGPRTAAGYAAAHEHAGRLVRAAWDGIPSGRHPGIEARACGRVPGRAWGPRLGLASGARVGGSRLRAPQRRGLASGARVGVVRR